MAFKSTYARRKGTGRKAHHTPIRRKPVHIRRHRRMRGIHAQPKGASERNRIRAYALVAKRRQLQAATTAARTAQLRATGKARSASLRALGVTRGKSQATSAQLRALAKARAAKKVSTKPKVKKIGKKTKVQTTASAISPQSYINMF